MGLHFLFSAVFTTLHVLKTGRNLQIPVYSRAKHSGPRVILVSYIRAAMVEKEMMIYEDEDEYPHNTLYSVYAL